MVASLMGLASQGQAGDNKHSNFLIVDEYEPRNAATCGVYALVFAASSLGFEIDVRDLLNSNFVSSTSGSSTHDLVDAAAEYGMVAIPYKDMNWLSLVTSPNPILLYTDQRNDVAGHWVTFLGMKNGRALIFDQARSEKLAWLSPGDLLAQWHGQGIVIAQSDSIYWHRSPWVVNLLQFSVLFIVAGITGWLIPQRPAVRSLLAVPIGLMAFLTFVVVVDASHIYRNPQIVAWIAGNYQDTNDFPEVSFEDVMRVKTDHRVHLVDARLNRQFRAIHLPGSINVPINVRSDEFASSILEMGRDDPVIVFCSGPRCAWATIIANRFSAAGFRNVQVFRGGIQVFALNDVYLEREL